MIVPLLEGPHSHRVSASFLGPAVDHTTSCRDSQSNRERCGFASSRLRERHLGPSAFPAVKRRPERPGSNPTQPQSKRLAHTLLTYDTPYISNTAAGEAGPGDTHTHSTLRPFSSKLPSSMGYYTRAETVTLAATAQSKIAVSVFLGIAGGLSRTESSFANLDWLLVRGPP